MKRNTSTSTTRAPALAPTVISFIQQLSAQRTPILIALLASTGTSPANPRLHSWFTANSGKYASIYQSTADESAGTAVTTWSRGQGVQAEPTYAGIHEISTDNEWVYIRTTGLASFVMGPWYLNAAKTNLFPNYPANRAVTYRLPLDPGPPPANKTRTGLGAIGYFVDGVAMFDSRDAFSYDTSAGRDDAPNAPAGVQGDDIWNRDAYVNEGVTFDAGNAHQAGSQYHYHANPPALRCQLGDSVDYDPNTNTYTENFNGGHSPILGWVRDGYPVYGPYGYSNPTDPGSGVRRMISGYQKRDGSNGTTNLAVTGRTSLPQWAVTVQGIGPNLGSDQHGPPVNGTYILGHYLEDYAYKEDLGMTLGSEFDLDRHNGRFCITPEFPEGTYAYFTCIETDGSPVYPYNIGRTYFGNPAGTTVGSIPGDARIVFEGGPETQDAVASISVDESDTDVVLVFQVAQGGTYEIESSSNLSTWSVMETSAATASDKLQIVDPSRRANDDRQFYRARRTGLAPFDDAGFDYRKDDGGTGDGTTSFDAVFPTNPPLPPEDAVTSVMIGGATATITAYNQATGEVSLSFDRRSLETGTFRAVLTFTPPGRQPVQVLSTNEFAVESSHNILLLIVDDWGVDASPLDNPGGTVANMPNLAALAADGVRFTRAYAQPTCSPTRATLMTGRHPHQTTVFTPAMAGNFSEAETTLPEAFTAAGSPYAMASMGKWHLGGNDNGYRDRGGWPEFYGINGGGVPDDADPNGYINWTKNSNGISSPSTTYTTTDQVNEALSFINRSENAGNPWFCWVAFNAPHTPFHDPAVLVPGDPSIVPPGGYSPQEGDNNNQWNYRKALETLDVEIGRLLAGVDWSNTNVILLGDNGTPNQVVQAPYGPRGAGPDAHGKGDLYEGGIHVPMVVRGPAVTVPPGSTSDKLVHVIDLFSTILELAGIDPAGIVPPDAVAQSRSILPIFEGTDLADRQVICETEAGRSITVGDHPDYKLIINGSPTDPFDTPIIEFYHLAVDRNEQSPLYRGPHPSDPTYVPPALAPVAQSALDACLMKDAELGGGFSDLPLPDNRRTYHFQLESPNAQGQAVPPLINPNNGNIVQPRAITVGGSTAGWDGGTLPGGTAASRVDPDGNPNNLWITFDFDPVAAGFHLPGNEGPHPVEITFPGGGGTTRVYTTVTPFLYTP